MLKREQETVRDPESLERTIALIRKAQKIHGGFIHEQVDAIFFAIIAASQAGKCCRIRISLL